MIVERPPYFGPTGGGVTSVAILHCIHGYGLGTRHGLTQDGSERLGVAVGFLILGGHTEGISVWITIMYTWIRQISFFKCFPFSIIYS